MMKRIYLYLSIMIGAALAACSDSDSFTTSRSAMLTFSEDTVKMDTVFTNVGSPTYTFWVFNNASDGLRISSVRLRQGNQTGFRVNVDGSYLDNTLGSVVGDLEVRKGDSLRVFVELTAPENMQQEALLVEDDLVFTLESGVQQRVVLQAHAWDALQLTDVVVSHDSVIDTRKPVVIYGGLRVDSAATLTIRGTTLFFHDKAGIDVYGTLITDSVLMRGDRLDHMFSYLPYDRVSGQWRGIRFCSSSSGNSLKHTEIRNAEDGIVCDSAAYSRDVVRLSMEKCVVHNCKGAGLKAFNALIEADSCQFTNTLDECVAIYGGMAILQHCTMGQFYPFMALRGAALRFCNFYNDSDYPLEGLVCISSIITGYDKDVVMGEARDTTGTVAYDYLFSNCLLRTPEPEEKDSTRFIDIMWESPDDSIQGKQHFVLIDETNLKYDFHLDSLSTAKGMGCY